MTSPPPPYGEYPPGAPGPGAAPEYYPGPAGFGGPAHPPPPGGTNGLAIASLVCAFLIFPLGIIFGHMSLSQIKRNHQEGRGLAIAGLVVGYAMAVLTVLMIIAFIVFAVFLVGVADRLDNTRSDGSSGPGFTASPQVSGDLPSFKAPANLGANCQYPATTQPASRPVQPPRTGRVPTTPATVPATIVTNDGTIGIELDNAKSPCTVNNFASLAQQGFFDDTSCHRLTTSASLGVLQCGDPTGKGTGGPGYQFPNEYPTNQYRLSDPSVELPVVYPRGTLAMANSGAGTNGSQFFLVYADSQLPPSYTVFGTIDEVGLAVVDKVAAGGVQGGSEDGVPTTGVTIQSVRLD